jgi:hypothetical protein
MSALASMCIVQCIVDTMCAALFRSFHFYLEIDLKYCKKLLWAAKKSGVHCTLYSVYCTLYTLPSTVYYVHCKFSTVQSTPPFRALQERSGREAVLRGLFQVQGLLLFPLPLLFQLHCLLLLPLLHQRT